MLLLDRQPTAFSQPGEGASRVHLRLRADGQLLELPPGKTMIGSSPRCNLRIQQPGVQPLHCLIVHAPEGLTVRRWAGDTRINGEPFIDASLTDGDCLALGGVELELIQELEARQFETPEDADAAPRTEANEAAADGASTSNKFGHSVAIASDQAEPNQAAELSEVMPTSAAAEIVFRELQMASEISRHRSRKLLAALRRNRDDLASLRELFHDVEQQLARAALERAGWNEERESHKIERDEWELQQLEWRRQVAGWEKRLADQLQQMNELQHELATVLAADMQIAIPSEQGVASWCEKDTSDEERPSEEPTVGSDQFGQRPATTIEWPQEAGGCEVPAATTFEADAEDSKYTAEQSADAPEEPSGFGWAIDRDDVSPSDLLECEDVGSGLETGSGREPTVGEFEWSNTSSFDVEAAPQEESLNTGGDVDAWNSLAASGSESTTFEGSADEQVETADSGSGWDERIGEQLENNVCEDVVGNDGPNQELFQDAAAADDQLEPSEEAAAFAEFSIWNQGTREQHTPTSEAAFESEETSEPALAWGDESSDVTSERPLPAAFASEETKPVADSAAWNVTEESIEREPVESVPQEKQSASFIERYSHMFADEEADTAHPAPACEQIHTSEPPSSTLPGVVRTEPSAPRTSGTDDEESIEQYMAKLLQRVRGDAPYNSASQTTPGKTKPAGAALSEPNRAKVDAESQRIMNREKAKRKSSAPAPKTDLGALRALANETARRAISRHELRKHRQSAITKVIVSTLAGVTSLWLMLNSPDWRDIQFITACLTLLVAAYWAGETCRTLLESLRAASYEGPEAGLDESDVQVPPALPIDVNKPL